MDDLCYLYGAFWCRCNCLRRNASWQLVAKEAHLLLRLLWGGSGVTKQMARVIALVGIIVGWLMFSSFLSPNGRHSSCDQQGGWHESHPPWLFFSLKKGMYHGCLVLSVLRHSHSTLANVCNFFLYMGISTAVMFTNSRGWSNVITMVVCLCLSGLARLWMIYGAPGGKPCSFSLKCVWFMQTGKPIPDKRMELVELRAYEVLAQTQFSAMGFSIIALLYPADRTFGEQSMIICHMS